VLLLRQRDAGDIDAKGLGEIDSEAAPAGTDVEDALAWLQRKPSNAPVAS